eukprot:scaffold3886_cov399-Prasinococcus_capsulatus_cf.AAC.23
MVMTTRLRPRGVSPHGLPHAVGWNPPATRAVARHSSSSPANEHAGARRGCAVFRNVNFPPDWRIPAARIGVLRNNRRGRPSIHPTNRPASPSCDDDRGGRGERRHGGEASGRGAAAARARGLGGWWSSRWGILLACDAGKGPACGRPPSACRHSDWPPVVGSDKAVRPH